MEEQRKGLSLAPLFAKPRPMWVAPAFIASFGDAFIQNTVLEGSSNLAWSYTVMNFALQRMIKNPLVLSDNFGLDYNARVGLSDTLHILQQSAAAFKLMLRMLKTPSESQLLSFLRKLKKLIQGVNKGETLLLPALVERQELIIILERTTDRLFRVTIVNTDAFGGLSFHAASVADSMPEILFRTCMVLNDVPKKNVLDDVFWMALYNMAINIHQGDTVKFYDVLVPFLTGKPLEVSLVESERCSQGQTADPSKISSVDTEKPAEISSFGAWRHPQRSQTAYVRCIFEALYFLLRRRGVTDIQESLVLLKKNTNKQTTRKSAFFFVVVAQVLDNILYN